MIIQRNVNIIVNMVTFVINIVGEYLMINNTINIDRFTGLSKKIILKKI